MKSINFAVIGCGLMGREFGSAVLRWRHLSADIAAPVIIGACDTDPKAREWFDVFPIKYSVSDYKELLDKPDIEAVYCAVPHHLHEKIYIDVINAGKHLMAEKPFGIDKPANERILAALNKNPSVFVRCSSEFPFFPACRILIDWLKNEKFGRILEIRAAFNHSGDLDLTKPINWKRQAEKNGEYGCIGDLGIHTQHIPLRMGFIPKNAYAVLTNAALERPDGKGGTAECDTWDNAVTVCETSGPRGEIFPMFLETRRMKPGATNQWSIEVYGMDASAKFTTDDPNAFHYTQSWGKEQAWSRLGVGYKPQIPTVTGPIFEFGFTDAILQMWAAFMSELEGNEAEFGCVKPEETAVSHRLLTAALKSYKEKRAVEI